MTGCCNCRLIWETVYLRALNLKELYARPKLRNEVFMTAAVDNIDHNPSYVTAQGAFHRTGISLFQRPTTEVSGEEREVINIIANQPSKTTKRPAQRPVTYTTVPPVILPKNQPAVPPLQGPFVSSCRIMEEAFSIEHKWLEYVRDKLSRENSEEIIDISWAAFHASQLSPDDELQLDVSSLQRGVCSKEARRAKNTTVRSN